MMKRRIFLISCLLGIACSALVFGFQIEVPDAVHAYNDVEVKVITEDGDPAAESVRFYVMEEGESVPLFLELTRRNGSWTGLLPGKYVRGEKLEYFAEVKGEDEAVYAVPESGRLLSSEIIQDTEPPQLEFVLPADGKLVQGERQAVLIRVTDESIISKAEITLAGNPLESVEITGKFVKAITQPDQLGDAELQASVTDAAGNTAEEVFQVSVNELKEPFFTVEGNYDASLDITYTASSDQEGLEVPGELLSDIAHEIEMTFALEGDAVLQGGPALLTASGVLSDSTSVFVSGEDTFGYFQGYPSSLLSDMHDILMLWNPWNFSKPFTYYGTDSEKKAREYENSNEFLVEFSLFTNIFQYRFGDQTIHFQDQTVKDLYFRGTSVHLDIPLLSLSVGQGLTDLGLYGEAWPRSFAGVNFGIDIFDYWWFNTNISFISDMQGDYDEITKLGHSPVGEKFGLYDEEEGYAVNPEENMVLGIGTGFNMPWFTLKGEGGLSIYTNNAGIVPNIEKIGDSLSELGVEFDITEYTEYLDMVQEAFPVFSYFPISLGLASLNSIGLTYSADFIIPALGVEAWFRKADNTYKSLGASVTNNIKEYGALWTFDIQQWGLSAGYNRQQNNMAGIIGGDILPLVGTFIGLPEILTDLFPSESGDVSDITHEASMKVRSPNLGAFGRLSGGYTFAWEKTSDDKNDAFIHTGDVSWKSKTFKFEDFSVGLGAGTKDSLTMNRKIDGVEIGSDDADSMLWDYSADASVKLGYRNISLSPSYKRSWGTADDSEIEQTIKAGLQLKKLWFDSIGLSGSWEEVNMNDEGKTWVERNIGTKLSVKKSFGIMSSGMDFSVDFTNAADEADDESSWKLKLWGGVSF